MPDRVDLDRRYADEDERATAIVRLLTLDQELRVWSEVSLDVPITLSTDQRDRLRAVLVPGDIPELKLKRWKEMFDEEIGVVHDARSRVVHSVSVGDPELRGAVWLAEHLLELLVGSSSST